MKNITVLISSFLGRGQRWRLVALVALFFVAGCTVELYPPVQEVSDLPDGGKVDVLPDTIPEAFAFGPRIFWSQIVASDSAYSIAVTDANNKGRWLDSLRWVPSGPYVTVNGDTLSTRAYARDNSGVTGDNQVLIYNGSGSLTIESGNTVDMSDLLDNTDAQTIDTLTLQGDTMLQVSLSGDGAPVKELDLSALKSVVDSTRLTQDSILVYYQDGAEVGRDTIAGTGGGADNLGDHTMTQNLQTNGNWISGDGGNEGIGVDASGKVGIGTLTPSYILDFNSTDAVRLPLGTTAQNPTGATGLLRYNSDSTAFTGYYNAQWNRLVDYDYLNTNYWTKVGNDLKYSSGNIYVGSPATRDARINLKAANNNTSSYLLYGERPNGAEWFYVDNASNMRLWGSLLISTRATSIGSRGLVIEKGGSGNVVAADFLVLQPTSLTGNHVGGQFKTDIRPGASNFSGTMTGAYYENYILTSPGSVSTGTLNGARFFFNEISHRGGLSTVNMALIDGFRLGNTGSSVTDARGIYIVGDAAGANNGIITNFHGIEIGNITNGVNNFAIKTGLGLISLGDKVGIGTTSPTAMIHLLAGTATANTAPLKFTSGTNLTTPEAGAMEWDGTNLYITQTTGPTRKTIAYVDTDDGSASDTTDGSGDITVSHTLGSASITVTATATGTTFYHVQVHTKTSTTFKIRFFDAAGAAVTATAVTADWIAKLQ